MRPLRFVGTLRNKPRIALWSSLSSTMASADMGSSSWVGLRLLLNYVGYSVISSRSIGRIPTDAYAMLAASVLGQTANVHRCWILAAVATVAFGVQTSSEPVQGTRDRRSDPKWMTLARCDDRAAVLVAP
jgi:hypothetical protein